MYSSEQKSSLEVLTGLGAQLVHVKKSGPTSRELCLRVIRDMKPILRDDIVVAITGDEVLLKYLSAFASKGQRIGILYPPGLSKGAKRYPLWVEALEWFSFLQRCSAPSSGSTGGSSSAVSSYEFALPGTPTRRTSLTVPLHKARSPQLTVELPTTQGSLPTTQGSHGRYSRMHGSSACHYEDRNGATVFPLSPSPTGAGQKAHRSLSPRAYGAHARQFGAHRTDSPAPTATAYWKRKPMSENPGTVKRISGTLTDQVDSPISAGSFSSDTSDSPHKPPPCNEFRLGSCPRGESCPLTHSRRYSSVLEVLRTSSAKHDNKAPSSRQRNNVDSSPTKLTEVFKCDWSMRPSSCNTGASSSSWDSVDNGEWEVPSAPPKKRLSWTYW